MPRPARLTPLAVSALALLEERPMHPYEMFQLLRERDKAQMFAIKAGSLYHTMSRLAELGLAEVLGTERDGNRPERTVYDLTAFGRASYITWVRRHLSTPGTPQEFMVALSEAHNLDPDEVEAILSRRAEALATTAETLRRTLEDVQARKVPDAYVLERSRRLALIEADVAWTTDLLRRLAAGAVVWSYDDAHDHTRQ